jgi:hypothetical protein
MKIDLYTRGVLTIIAIALVYLGVVLTPLPTVSAQRGLRPGDDTGPAQVVVVGWRTTDRAGVDLADRSPLRVTGDVSINGLVQVDLPPNKVARVSLVGWEENAPNPTPPQGSTGAFRGFNSRAQNPTLRGVPITAYPPW